LWCVHFSTIGHRRHRCQLANFLMEDGFYKPPDPNSNNRLMYIVKSLKDFTVLSAVLEAISRNTRGS
jgi:hypothetical protein